MAAEAHRLSARAPTVPATAAAWRDRLPERTRPALDVLAAALPASASLYLVGGTVRDALLGDAATDLDLAVEGAAPRPLLRALCDAEGGEIHAFDAFGTGRVQFDDGAVVDLVRTRRERYDRPGALPRVRPAPIRDDLARRDFAANAIAVRWAPGPVRLLDPFAGRRDLRGGWLRMLHAGSFRDDPTRALRGARLAARLGWRFAPGTAWALRDATTHARAVSRDRWRAELERTFAEPRVAPALRLLAELGLLARIYGLPAPGDAVDRLDALSASREPVPPESYLLALLWPLAPDVRREAAAAAGWGQRPVEVLAHLARLTRDAGGALDRHELGEAGAAFAAALGGLPARAAAEAFDPAPEPRVSGSDVLALGLAPGPAVGDVLAEVRRARRQGRVEGFAQELALARELVRRERTSMERRNDAS